MTLQRDEWKNKCAMIKVTLRDVEANCNHLVNRGSELEQSNMAQHSALQEATKKLHVALEDKDAVKRDYSALVEASEAKDTP
jgi:Na+/phosphate symporter